MAEFLYTVDDLNETISYYLQNGDLGSTTVEGETEVQLSFSAAEIEEAIGALHGAAQSTTYDSTDKIITVDGSGTPMQLPLSELVNSIQTEAQIVTWTDVQNKPSVFPPEAHNHDTQYYTQAQVDARTFSGSYTDLSDVPTEFTPKTHFHAWASITSKPTVFPPEAHNHDGRYYTETEVDSLLSGYATSAQIAAVVQYSDEKVDDRVSTLIQAGSSINTVYDEVAGTLTISANTFSGNYADLTGAPTALSSFTNDVGYITGYTVTQGDVTAHEAALSISESQIAGLNYYTDEKVDDRVATLLTGGSNINITYNDSTGQLTISADGSSNFSGSYNDLTDVPTTFPPETHSHGWAEITGKPTTFPPEAHTHDGRYYTETEVDTLLSSKADSTAVFSGNYADLTGAPTALSSFTNDVGFITGYTVTQSDVTTHQGALSIDSSQITNLTEYSDEKVDDRVSALIVGGANVNITYDDVSGTLTIDSPTGESGYDSSSFDVDFASKTTDNLSEGATNQYFTPERAQSAISVSGDLSYTNGVISYSTPTIPSDVSDLSDSTGLLNVTWSDVSGKPTFATVATTGSYNDLSNTPTIPSDVSDLSDSTGLLSVTWSEVSGKPTFATIATSGDYNDLINTPTIPSDVSDLSDSTGLLDVTWTEVSGKPTFHAVATSGDYNDLINTPTLATVATTGSYTDLLDKPTIPSARTDEEIQDVVSGTLVGGSNVTLTYDDAAGTLTIDSSGSSGGASALNDLTDVDTATAAPTDSQTLLWNNTDSEWQPGGVDAALTNTEWANLIYNRLDFTYGGVAGDYYGGEVIYLYINAPMAYIDDFNASVTPSDGDVIAWNASFGTSGAWEATTPSSGGGGAASLTELSDVDTTQLTKAYGQVILYDGAKWVNSKLDYTDINNTPTLATVATTGSYSDLSSIPTTFTPEAHTHPWSEVTGKPTFHAVATSGSYNDLSNVPTTFTPAAHTHPWAEVTGKPAFATVATSGSYNDLTNVPTTFNPSAHTHPWSEVTGKPSTYTPESHLHTSSDVTDLGSAATKNITTASTAPTSSDGSDGDIWIDTSEALSGGSTVDWTDVQNKPSTFTPSSHTHSISDVTNLQSALNGKQDTITISTSQPSGGSDGDVWYVVS